MHKPNRWNKQTGCDKNVDIHANVQKSSRNTFESVSRQYLGVSSHNIKIPGFWLDFSVDSAGKALDTGKNCFAQ